MAMEFQLPEGWLAIVTATITNLGLLVWHASNALFRLRDHEKRLDKLETKVADHSDKLDQLISELRERLARIEGLLSVDVANRQSRRNLNP